MKYCVKCGNAMEDDMSFCQKCGAKAESDRHQSPPMAPELKAEPIAPQPFKARKGMRVVSIICIVFAIFAAIMAISTDKSMFALVAFMAIIGIMFFVLSKTPKEQKRLGKNSAAGKGMKKSAFVLICIVAAFIAFGTIMGNTVEPGTSEPSNRNGPVNAAESTPDNNKTGSPKDNEPETNTLFADVIDDEALRLDFINACEQIGMDAEKIDDLKQVDDWVSGTRYSFTYSGGAFRLYCNMDSTVNCIKLGTDTDIYKQGYEPYQISDYIVDSSVSAELQIMTEDYVKSQLNYPATADFPWLDWSYGRERDLYSVSSKVTAKNAFGVEDELAFRLIYQVDGSSATLVYFELDGAALVNNMDSISTPERKKIEAAGTNTESETGAIVLTYGELGEYGKTITLDGSDYINYHVPAGTYTITNNGKWCKIYLAKDEYFKNSDGYMENEIIETIEFSDYGETKTVVIGSGEHLELTISATVTLTTND